MDDEENIIHYRTSPTLTVKQAVMYMLGYRGEFTFHISDREYMTFDIYTYLYNLQEEADCAAGNAYYELEMLKRAGTASPEEITDAEQKVESTRAELEEANKLPIIAENYRLLINHEISRIRLGKRSPLVIDEDQSAGGKTRIITASFEKWLDGMELDDAEETPVPVKLPIVDDAFDKKMELTKETTESLFLTLGLLVSLYAESSGEEFGSGLKPNIANISEKIDEHGKRLNKGKKLVGQGKSAVKKRIDVALSALHSGTFIKISF